MAKIRCDQCKAVSSTSKGYCPECGAIFVPPYAIIGEDEQVRFSTVRDDMGQGKERKLLIKKSGGAATAEPDIDIAEAPAERTLADLAPSSGRPVPMMSVPVGETAFPGFALLLTLLAVIGWVTLLGGPLAAAMIYRSTHIDLAVIWSLVGFFVGLVCLVLAGAGQVMVAMETHLRGLRSGNRPD
ncbi:MAG: hypothetical protein H7338_13370 [Candidatus Sericytochromatia bacterium]|nr:hypothetical protein [Candidatus Sericytochromatia bacterium]